MKTWQSINQLTDLGVGLELGAALFLGEAPDPLQLRLLLLVPAQRGGNGDSIQFNSSICRLRDQ